MRTYRINDGDTLVVSVDGAAWETITFDKKDFENIDVATADELTNVLNRSNILTATVDENECLVLATASKGGLASLDFDVTQSTVATRLGLIGAQAHAHGSGLHAARLVSLARAPFPLPLGAELTINVDASKARITFGKGITEGKASAAQVVEVINARIPGLARASREARIMLTSPSVGLDSRLAVTPGRTQQGKVDAAAILGFVGVAAFSQPCHADPARLVACGLQAALRVVNLTASPIELHFSIGTTLLPAHGSLPLSHAEVAHSSLQRLIERGIVQLMPATEG